MRVFSINSWASFLAIALTFSQFGPVTQAVDVNVSSLPPANGSNQQHDIKADLWYANAFTIDNTSNGVINTIFLALDPGDQPPPPSISKANALDVNVYVSNPDGSVNYTPTGFIGSFSFNNSVSPYPGSVANAPYSYNGDPNQSISLTADKYWIVVSTNQNLATNDKVSWFKKNQAKNEVGSFATILPDIREYNVTTGNWSTVNSGNQMMRFAIVPEPSTYVLGAVMTGVLAFVSRYQARQKMAVKPAA